MNNLQVITVTTPIYTDCFGFTEEEVFSSMDEYNLPEKEKIKEWYDGFVFGGKKDIYNPWSILKYLSLRELDTYWVDTSSNALVSELIQQSDPQLKMHIEALLQGKTVVEKIDEQVAFNRLNKIQNSVLSLLVASGYLKIISYDKSLKQYVIAITNHEVKIMMDTLISEWFNSSSLYSVSNELKMLFVKEE